MTKDPVCRMELDEDDALETAYGDRVYYFCSESCLDRFRANPTRYADRREESPIQGAPRAGD